MPHTVNHILHRNENTYYRRLYSVGVYDGALKKAIRLLKYRNRPHLAKPLAQLLIEFAQIHLNMKEFNTVACVPLHSAKIREREFNQADLLARPLSRKFGVVFSAGKLRKNKSGPSQSNLNRSKRLKNLKGTFSVHDHNHFNDKNVLLVDDVFTTGATVNECSRALLDAGAKTVSVLTLARGE